MLPTEASQQLGRLIKEARRTVRLSDGSSPSQAWVAGRFSPPRTPQQIGSFEQGTALPTIEVLAELYAILRSVTTSASRSPAEFIQWMAAWLAVKEVRDEAGRQVLREAVELLASTPVRPSSSSSPPRPLASLADFPGSDPFTIIFGDRRESRVTSAAECLIYSGSITDVFHLPQLGAAISNSTIESDKLLVRMPRHFLVNTPEIAERNLLIVGSPAANWGARILNEVAVFPFRIDQNVVDRVRRLMNDSRMQDRDFASWFWESAQVDPERRKNAESDGIGATLPSGDRWRNDAVALAEEVLEGTSPKVVMNRFRTLGILDPADQENHGTSYHQANDFAVVTLAQNPYCESGRYRAVICGGIHGPGTATALRELLVNPTSFANHPLGAVLEININVDLDWRTRFRSATATFQTKEYGARTIYNNLRAAVERDAIARRDVYQWWNEESLRRTTDFVRQLVEESGK